MPGVVYFAVEILINLRYTGISYILHFITDELSSNSQFSADNSHLCIQFHAHMKMQTKIVLGTIVWKFVDSADKERKKYLTEWYQAFSDFVCEDNNELLLSFLNI